VTGCPEAGCVVVIATAALGVSSAVADALPAPPDDFPEVRCANPAALRDDAAMIDELLDGARVVGIAGGPEKCAMLTERLGFDAAVDYKAPGWRDQLIAATPDRIDVDFENVGGEIMDAIFARLNLRARVALCGLISGYNDDEPPPGPRGFGNLLVQRALVKGFIVLDHFDRLPEAVAELSGWIAEGKLEPLETVVEGFEELPRAINMLFDGANTGKLVVHLNDG